MNPASELTPPVPVTPTPAPPKRPRRGFASLTQDQRVKMARIGGLAAWKSGKAHRFSPGAEAARAGSKGGKKSRGGRGRVIPGATNWQNQSDVRPDIDW
jgi:hypothetical protein